MIPGNRSDSGNQLAAFAVPPLLPTIAKAPEIDMQREAMARSRIQRFTVELLDAKTPGWPVMYTDLTVTTGQLDLDGTKELPEGGSVTLRDVIWNAPWLPQNPWDFDRVLIRVKAHVLPHGEDTWRSWTLGTYQPSLVTEQHYSGYRWWDVNLHSVLLWAQQDLPEQAQAVPAGTSVAAYVSAQLAACGLPVKGVQEVVGTVRTDKLWEEGTSRLKICNDVLRYAGYTSLIPDGEGVPRTRPLVDTSGVRYTWRSGIDCTFSDRISLALNTFEIPNKIVVVCGGRSDEPAIIGTAINDDPTSPWSIPSVGRIRARKYTNSEATTQSAADSQARSTLKEWQPTPKLNVEALLVPLSLLDDLRIEYIYPGTGEVYWSGRWEVRNITYHLVVENQPFMVLDCYMEGA